MKDASGLLLVLADQLSDGIIMAGESGIACVNPSGLMLLGADRSEEVIGKSLTSFLRTDEFPETLQQKELCQGDAWGTPTSGNLHTIDGSASEAWRWLKAGPTWRRRLRCICPY